MKKAIVFSILFLIVFFAANGSMLAESIFGTTGSIENVCWSVNGWPLKTSLMVSGMAGTSLVVQLSGVGTTLNAPISGTILIPPSGNLTLSFAIFAASASQYAVMHQVSLDRTTLNGTGFARWFDSTQSGTDTITFTSCTTLSNGMESTDRVGQGLR